MLEKVPEALMFFSVNRLKNNDASENKKSAVHCLLTLS